MKDWECQCYGHINTLMNEDLDILEEFYCSRCGNLHIIEELCDGELSIEMF